MGHTLPLSAIPAKSVVRVYLRRSLGEQQQAASLDTQRSVCERLARALDLPWAERVEYTDENRHGDDFTRPGLQSLISESRGGDVVLAYDDSRIGRDALECARVIRDLVRTRGARLYYAATGTEANAATAIDDVMNVLRGLGAQSELEKIRTRTRDALRERASAGYATGMVPFGYRTVPVDASEPSSKKRIEIDPEAAETVRAIFNWYADGAGPGSIVRRLNNGAVRAPRSRWSPSTVWDLLRNRAYREGRGRPAVAIIDDELWARVSESMATRKRDMTANSRAAKHPLSGVLRCICGGPLRIKRCHGRHAGWKRIYYVCARRATGAPCDNAAHIFADVAERQIATYLASNVLPRMESEIREAIRGEIRQAASARTTDVGTLSDEIARLKAEQKRLTAAIAVTDDPIPELIERMKANRDTLRRLESNLALASASPLDETTASRIEAAAVAHLASLRDLLIGDRELLRDGLKALFPSGLRLVVDGDGGPCAEGEASGASHSVRTPPGFRTVPRV